MEVLVSIRSTHYNIKKLLEQIEKLSIFELWIRKAQSFLEAYNEKCSEIDKEQDSLKKGFIIQDCESSFATSVHTYLRCFLDQHGFHLEINKLTDDEGLLECYRKIESLRHDEFVHWKGLRSTVNVKYFFEQKADGIYFTGKMDISFSDSIGPHQSIDNLRKLYAATLSYVDKERGIRVGKILKHLENPDAFAQTAIETSDGKPLFPKK